ncbi:MAG: 4-(cytidine 5'-diphospho)-2-C-methyl-D-erythritol kinase [Acidimicrobiia bacterium]
MSRWEAPAKINLSLEVRPPDAGGMHPLRSLVQTIAWCDELEIDDDDDDHLEVGGADIPDDGENLVWKAVSALRRATGQDRPRLHIGLTKNIPVAAGLGGGSSDAAAALLAVADLTRTPRNEIEKVAATIGADVPYLLLGGSAWMEGYGEQVTQVPLPVDYAVGVAVPNFELVTQEVYGVWDRLEYPRGSGIDGRALPPALRDLGPFRNDLSAAAIALRPELGDWMAELADRWERPVAMSGSGPSLFAFFGDLDEAEDAVRSVAGHTRAVKAVNPRGQGPSRLS